MSRSAVEVEKLNTLTGHKDCIYTIVAGEDDQTFYSGAGDGMVARWQLSDPDTGHLLAKLDNSIYALALDSANRRMILGHNYDGIHVIDIDSKKEISSLQLTKGAIFDIQVIEKLVGVATGDGEFILITLDPEPRILRKMKLADKSARCISYLPKRNEVAIGFSDHKIRILDLTDLSIKHTLSDHTNSVFTVRYSPDGRYLLSAGRDAHLKIWDAATYVLVEDIVAHMYAINHIDFSPNGKHFVTCSMDKSIKVWDLQTFKLMKVIDKARHAGHGTSVNKLYWAPYHNQLISASDDRSISIWDLKFNV